MVWDLEPVFSGVFSSTDLAFSSAPTPFPSWLSGHLPCPVLKSDHRHEGTSSGLQARGKQRRLELRSFYSLDVYAYITSLFPTDGAIRQSVRTGFFHQTQKKKNAVAWGTRNFNTVSSWLLSNRCGFLPH